MDNVEVEDREFSSIVDTLVSMFGNVLNEDVITAVVENCAGDLNLSAEAIMNMTDGNSSQNTDTDVRPITIPPEDINSSMDLISFTSNDDNNLRLYKVDSNQGTRENCIPSQANVSSVTAALEPAKNERENVKSELNIESMLNVDARAFNPRPNFDNIQLDTGINTITNYMDRPEPSTSRQTYKSEPTADTENTFHSLISYSERTRKTGALPKKLDKPVKTEPGSTLSPELRRIAEYHSKNVRTLIVMRGAPGSGKSYLSRKVVQATVGYGSKIYKCHVFSTDDYFSLRGPYEFNKFRLKDAHAWNQHRARTALESGLSPVIIDNTNIEIWEMEPYFRYGVANGYKIEILEPKTPWAKKPNQLVKKNIHGVPLTNITRMLDNYEENLTSDYLINCYKLKYPEHMTPPVLRNHPPVVASNLNNEEFVPESVRMVTTNKRISPVKDRENINYELSNPLVDPYDSLMIATEKVEDVNSIDSKVHMVDNTRSNEYSTPEEYSKAAFSGSTSTFKNDDVDINEENKKPTVNPNIKKQLEEYERVDIEWESNPPWDDNIQNENNSKSFVRTEPKPPRKLSPTRSGFNEDILHSPHLCPNWADISMFMKPWSDGVQIVEKEPVRNVEMMTSGTSVEIGDTDIYNNHKIYKVISANPRDINEHFISPYREKIPEKRMLDKSTMTNDRLITDIKRCKNEERHFKAFRNMFKTISKSGLRDIFDQCLGDVNWAVEIVVEGISNNQLQFTDELDLSDIEEENPEECTCLAAYNIVPDKEVERVNENTEAIPEETTDNMHSNRKPKREVLSDVSIQLKRQIEQNVVISDNHYSQHCLKLRKFRRGESEIEENRIDDTGNASALVSFRADQDSSAADCSDADSNVSVEELEKIVNMNVGHEFIKSIDHMYGRSSMKYPENVLPKLSIPLSLLNELNALWMESLMDQLDDYDKQSAAMVKQDEEFARQLSLKEKEMAEAGKEPEVPDFKEIMDMDFAIALYQKDVAEWRNKVPDNLAAKLTRDKLFNLFPDVPQDTLSELLVAHDNNFKSTVEVLFMSTGKSHLLQEKNGLVKFIMDKERERQEKIVEDEKKALLEVEWPLLPKGEKADMATVDKYRQNAAQHLSRRNQSYNMAQQYIHRGMTSVAVYYSDMAAFHKMMFDQANSRAAATLIQVNAQNSPSNATVDLHYLRVSEALETLDIFLDSHISKLRDLYANNRGPRYLELYFITGRGLHSHGGPRVKPAVRKRLRARGLNCRERNPGLLCARVTADDKLSHQVQT